MGEKRENDWNKGYESKKKGKERESKFYSMLTVKS